MANDNPFRVWLTNHGYYVERRFSTVDAAIDEARRIHFDSAIHRQNADGSATLVASWSVFGGERHYRSTVL